MIQICLRLFGLVCVFVGFLHVALGPQADNLLGAGLTAEITSNASLDSQNRFYGAAFMLFGVAAWHCAEDLVKGSQLFRAMMIIFFIGGLARIVSAAQFGMPALAIQFLALTELAIPPVFLWWHRQHLKASKARGDDARNGDIL